MADILIRNETPSRLILTNGDAHELVLPPLAEKEVAEEAGFDFDELLRKGILSLPPEAPTAVGQNLSVVLFGGGFWAVVICSVLANMDPFFGISRGAWPYVVWGAGSLVLAVAVTVLIIRSTNSLSLVIRWTLQAVALTLILAIGLGLPAATIYYFGGGQALLDASAGQAPTLALFGRLLQLAMIATASLLPVLLFFLFDRYQLGTLRRRLYASLFRLDRSVTTTGEINAKYGSIREAYGFDDHGRGRLSPGSRWPVLVCAFVITIGWIIAIAPVGTDYAPQSAEDVLASLLPRPSPLVFGFLGVYFFSLRLIALRYARGDLKPKAYTQIVVRVFIVAVLSWVLQAISSGGDEASSQFHGAAILLLAFLFGITPDEFFTWLKETFRGQIPGSAIPQSTLPLNELEGIDLYDLGRLESEGVVNIEGLAHHELIDLIIETRIPVPRLVDWVDQAILYLHLAGSSDATARATLRNYGIRTATDLLVAWEKASERGSKEFDAFKKLLGDDRPPYRLEVIRDALMDDEWMKTVSCWRDDAPHEPIVHRAVRPSPRPSEVSIPQPQIPVAASAGG